MTDHKSWLWRRKSSEKQNLPSNSNEEEMHMLLSEKAELKRDLKDLSDKLSIALSECNANNELAHENAKMAQDALSGWEKAEAHASSLKEELDEALERRAAHEERAIQLEAALKECMKQLRFVGEEKEQRIRDVVSKLAKDYDEKRLVFEEDLNQKAANANADLKEALTRLESTEKRNASLKYELQVLERELQIRNEEKDFNRQTSNATHKLHLENVKKIAKLESECQRLRVLVRKRLPGPASMTRMKSEVEMLESSPTKKINLLLDKLHALEEDNKSLRETLEKKTDALQISRNMFSHASLKLTQAEAQIEELSMSKTQIIRSADFGFDDKLSCAWSSASTMISELTEKGVCARSPISNARSLEINLMDDFVEMEKLALVCDAAGKQIQSGVSESVSKLIQIIEGFDFQTTNKENSDARVHDIHVFQWKSSEVAAITQSFVHVCYDLLNGEVDLGKFSREVASTLEWIINHCISLRDSSSMKDAIKKQFGWGSELSVASTSGYQGAIPLLQIQSSLKEEIGKLKEKIKELESAKKEVEDKLEAMVDDSNSLSVQLVNKKLENEDLKAQLLSLHAESEYKTKQSEELEARCNELQIQLESTTTMDIEDVRSNEDGKQLQTNWDVTAASEKLEECQETIFSLGRQLKAMQECQETTPRERGSSRRSSLLDKMLAEDNAESQETVEMACTPEPLKPPPGFLKGSINPMFESDSTGQSFREAGFGACPLVIPIKKKQRNAGLLKKLMWRKRKCRINKLALAFSTC